MEQNRFTFLSRIIGIPVIDDLTGKPIGRAADVAAGLKEMYPKASGLIVRRGRFGPKAYVPWKDVKKVVDGEGVYVENPPAAFARELQLPEGEILLKDTFWDKQIVDIAGSKVVRVNDLHLLREESSIWVIHMDVGITGLFRRLGCLRLMEFACNLLFSYQLKDRLISWKFVQPAVPGIAGDALSLKVHHSRLAELHPADLAEILVDLGVDGRIAVVSSLDKATAASTFQELPMDVRTQMAETLGRERLVEIVDGMAMDEAVDLLAQLPRKTKDALLARLPQQKVARINELLQLSRRVAGSIMNTDFLSVKEDMTAGQALERVREEAGRKESIYHTYVLNGDDTLVGVLTLRQLLTADPATPASKLMRKRVIRVFVDTNIKQVAEYFAKYSFTVMPVVDRRNKVQGIITMKDAFVAECAELRTAADAINEIHR